MEHVAMANRKIRFFIVTVFNLPNRNRAKRQLPEWHLSNAPATHQHPCMYSSDLGITVAILYTSHNMNRVFGKLGRDYLLQLRTLRLKRMFAIQDIVFAVLGVASATFGLKAFLLPNSFLDGGVTGISLLVQNLTGFNVSILIVLFNIPFILMGVKQISVSFALKTAGAILMLSLLVYFISFPLLTDDRLLTALFGGFFLGLGIGLCMRGGCVIDGTEVMALYVMRHTFLTVGDAILIFNVIIFLTAAILIDVEVAMYGMLTYLAASKTVDFVVTGIEEYIGVTIVSDRSSEVQRMIIEKLNRGVTIYNGKKGHGKTGTSFSEVEILFVVVTRLELSKLKNEVFLLDDRAFVVEHNLNDTRGGMVKGRPLH
jgi:uncharacterized membrane-anchored protein YitT (DUF2179 family)